MRSSAPVLPALEAGARLEFYSRALSLVADVRQTGDGEAVRLAEELCRKLAWMRPTPPRASEKRRFSGGEFTSSLTFRCCY
jgi:hypothetical protein